MIPLVERQKRACSRCWRGARLGAFSFRTHLLLALLTVVQLAGFKTLSNHADCSQYSTAVLAQSALRMGSPGIHYNLSSCGHHHSAQGVPCAVTLNLRGGNELSDIMGDNFDAAPMLDDAEQRAGDSSDE
eukprot:1349793-Rhodomonas_salina.1